MAKEKKKILIIEDDEFVRKLYREQLQHEGFDFVEAINGVEGVEKARSEHPDLILLDLMLPKMNGFDALVEIKDDKTTKNIPIFVLSNLGQQSDMQIALALGTEDYLIKSDHRLSEVVKRIKKRLGQ
jgi:DNA-binding response OmpR family regulator